VTCFIELFLSVSFLSEGDFCKHHWKETAQSQLQSQKIAFRASALVNLKVPLQKKSSGFEEAWPLQ
jgi:hypothetical protein